MKGILFSMFLAITILSLQAEDKKVAVFDPAGDVTSSIREVVREEISSVIVNIEGYSVLERTLIDKVLEENKFQQGGLVDGVQIGEIGKKMGANYVLVSSITAMDDNYYISCKLIEVFTAKIEKQKTARTTQGVNDLIDVAQGVVKTMFGQETNLLQNSQSSAPQSPPSVSQNTSFSQSDGKEIVFSCEKFPPLANSKQLEGQVEVLLDGEKIWAGGTDGFFIKIKDPKPGVRILQVTVKAVVKEGQKLKVLLRGTFESGNEVPMPGGSGGTFKINTQEKDYYELQTNIWNFKVKLKK
ncbi:MAG: CsgG/HfaB family protein [Prevotellaceae bacterium]|nr:CsgG/HfaB family protein [Prevotellaceae bacterium]